LATEVVLPDGGCRTGPRPKSSGLAPGGAKCNVRRSGTRVSLATWVLRLVVSGAELDCEEDSTWL